MKTRVLRTLLIVLSLGVTVPSFAALPNETPTTLTPEQRAHQLQNRLEEIHAMDVSKLSRVEKKALRAEVKEIKKEMKVISGGVYLSIGAIILIVLLIILLA